MDDFAVVREATLESMEESLRRRVRRACAAASVSFSPMVGGVCACAAGDGGGGDVAAVGGWVIGAVAGLVLLRVLCVNGHV